MIIGYVRGQSLTLAAPRVVADSINYLEGRFITSFDWAGLSIWAHFSKGDTFYDIPLDDEGRFTKQMQLNLTAGDWNVYVHGNEFLGDEVVERITTNTVKLIVEPTGALNGEPFPSITTSAGERIIAQAMGYATDAAEAANDAEAAAQTYPYIDSVSKHWMVWDVTTGEYVDTGISAEGQGGGGGSDGIWLPNVSADGVISWQKSDSAVAPTPRNIKGAKGDKGAQGERGEKGEQGEQGMQGERGADGAKGDKGDKGDRGEQGVKGDKGDTGADGRTPVKGVDYFTDADIAEIVDDVIAALPMYQGGSY